MQSHSIAVLERLCFYINFKLLNLSKLSQGVLAWLSVFFLAHSASSTAIDLDGREGAKER